MMTVVMTAIVTNTRVRSVNEGRATAAEMAQGGLIYYFLLA
jgi:hypothetical protein